MLVELELAVYCLGVMANSIWRGTCVAALCMKLSSVEATAMKYAARLTLTLGLVLCATPSCSGKGTTDKTSSCPVGSEKCPCNEDSSCDSGLQCLSDLCV